MEPCLFRHGKFVIRVLVNDNTTLLQWSHVFSDMVRGLRRAIRVGKMQLQWSHVFSDMVSFCEK
mgnify:CR=1 FL=1